MDIGKWRHFYCRQPRSLSKYTHYSTGGVVYRINNVREPGDGKNLEKKEGGKEKRRGGKKKEGGKEEKRKKERKKRGERKVVGI